MNIHDYPSNFTAEDIPRFFEYIFKRQHELAEKYIPIEQKNNLRWTTDYPVNVDSGVGQAQLKDMAWRALEEVAESYESLTITQDSKEHAQEELADGLHFITEQLLLAGLSYKDLELDLPLSTLIARAHSSSIENLICEVTVRIGISMNNLKMKPWKQTPMLTDKNKLKHDLIKGYQAYLTLMFRLMSPVEALNFYFSKSKVNDFRIRSNY